MREGDLSRRAMRAVAVLAGATAVAAAASGAGTAAAEDGSRQHASLVFTDKRPGVSSGLRLTIDYVNPDDPDGKPPAVQTVIETLAEGARIDTSVPDACSASDAELIVRGPAACPGGSRVGEGTIRVDTGAPGPARHLDNDVTFLNNRDELIFFIETRTTPLRSVVRAEVEERRMVSEAPPLPGVPPPDPFTAVDVVEVDLGPVTRRRGARRRGYITTPRSCPPGGVWTNSIEFRYRDGVSQTVESPSPCRR